MMFKKIFICIVFIVCMFGSSINVYANDNDDELDDYIEIWTAEDLYNIRYNLDGNYKLMTDIDLSEATMVGGIYDFEERGWKPIGSDNSYQGTAFTGVFDGQGYSIKGMRISGFTMQSDGELGLFSINNGTIRNLIIKDSIIDYSSKCNTYCGIVVGKNEGTISNIFIYNSEIKTELWGKTIGNTCTYSSYIGGISGANYGSISSSYSEVFLDMKAYGYFNYLGKEYHYAKIMVSGISNNGNECAMIEKCFSECSFAEQEESFKDNGVFSQTAYIKSGGISIGEIGSVENCYSTSGLCDYGISDGGTITSSYYIGKAKSQNTGSANNCYYFTGKGIADEGWIGLNDLQMKKQSFFEGFDFDNIWYMSEETVYKYPQLRSIKNGVTKVEIISEPTNEIVVGTTLKYENAVARIYRENGTTEDVILSPSNTTGGDTSTVGKKTVTYTYKGASATFEIDVVDVRANELEIVSLPNKTVYKEGEEFDPDGLSVNVKYNNGDVLPCTGYELSSIDDSAGEKNIEITYLDLTTSFEITYEKKDIDTLEIISEPDKTEYIEGEDFNPDGMVVKAVFTDGTSRNITDYIVGEISGTGEVEIEISRDGIGTTITINVLHDLECIEENVATCIDDGNKKYYKCIKCNRYFSDGDAKNEIEEKSWIINALGHNPLESVKENEVFAECEKDGYYDEVVYCSRCGFEISRNKKNVKKLGHSCSEWKVTTPATITTEGIETRVCQNCDYTETRSLEKLQSEMTTEESESIDKSEKTQKEDITQDDKESQSKEETKTDSKPRDDSNNNTIEPIGEKIGSYQNCEFYKEQDDNIRCYYGGNPVINEFKCDGTYTYYFQADGTAMKDRLTYHPDGEHVIYFDSAGHEVFSDFANVKKSISGDPVDDYCFFDVFGYMYVNVLTYDKSGSNLYYANPYGVMEMGEWFQFSDTVKWADGTSAVGVAGGYGYANADGTLMTNSYTTDWLGRNCYLQGNGVAIY